MQLLSNKGHFGYFLSCIQNNYVIYESWKLQTANKTSAYILVYTNTWQDNQDGALAFQFCRSSCSDTYFVSFFRSMYICKERKSVPRWVFDQHICLIRIWESGCSSFKLLFPYIRLPLLFAPLSLLAYSRLDSFWKNINIDKYANKVEGTSNREHRSFTTWSLDNDVYLFYYL